MLLKKHTWRDFYNPISGLSMPRLVAMENAAERGQYADLQWFYYHMEKADVTILSAMSRRLAPLNALDWEIRTVENADPALAQEQAAMLRSAYELIENFREATLFLASGLFRGFAHLEKIPHQNPLYFSRLDPVEQWFWVRDGHFGPWCFNAESQSSAPIRDPVEPARLCVFESTPLHRPIGRHFFSKSLAAADWDTALETSANPSIFIIGPPGTSPDKELEYKEVAEKIASNGRGYLPNQTDVKYVDTANRSRLPFQERIRYCDEQIVMAATGGLLTMLTESGSGTLAGGAHSEGLLALAKSDAAQLSETYQRDLDKPWLDKFFPGWPHAAYFQFDIPQQENVNQLLENVANLNWAGYRVDMQQLEEKSGLKLIAAPMPQ